jgi:ribose 5-phosphate isomerase B
MKIAIASDHAAVDLKAVLREYLIGLGHEVADLGPETADRVDYPDYGYKLASVVADGTAQFGVALCGSGSAFRSRSTATPSCAAPSFPSRCLPPSPVSTTMPTASQWAHG